MIDVQQAFRNVMQLLQQQPRRYKLFGIYWWPIKTMLRDAGYGPDQLYMLGEYQDPGTAALVPPMPMMETLAAACREYAHNARYGRPGGVVEDPDGEMVTIYDEDAGI